MHICYEILCGSSFRQPGSGLYSHARVLDSHAQVLDSQARALESHARVLDSHARVSDSQARVLEGHARDLDIQVLVVESHAHSESLQTLNFKGACVSWSMLDLKVWKPLRFKGASVMIVIRCESDEAINFMGVKPQNV